MSKKPAYKPLAPQGYLFSVSAHHALVGVREHLKLLAHFTEPRGEEPDALYVSPDALSALFNRIAADVDEVIAAASPQGYAER